MRERAFFCGYAYSDDQNAGHSDAELAARMAEIAAQQVRDTGAGLFEYKIDLHSIDCEIGIFLRRARGRWRSHRNRCRCQYGIVDG